jgi:hypothetical protein
MRNSTINERVQMKKPKRPFEWEDEQESSNKFEFDLDDDPDEGDIIELDEVVEVQGDSAEEDDLGGEIEVLDADGDLDLDDFGKPESESDDILGDDFLKEFTDSDLKEPLQETLEEEKDFDSLLDFDEAMALEPEEDVDIEELLQKGKGAGGEVSRDVLPSVDGFVAQIEERLLTAVRDLVEARLPQIVRDVLKEEIERLKNESE